ncbi:xanthine dehydrogenase/oxidase-like [Glandiceps talaboti]
MMSTMSEEEQSSDELVFYVNGRKVIDKNIDPETTLLSYLRNKLHLTGSKLGCGEGGCGACTVMLSRYDHQDKKILHQAINACYTPTCAVHGMAVTTVEGVGSSRTKLHPVQERLAKTHGLQCGFCTPGIVMSMYALLRSNTEPVTKEIEGAIKGNLCRCTGYRTILGGLNTFAVNGCCGNPSACGLASDKDKNVECGDIKASDFVPYDPSQEPIFPPELQLDGLYNSSTVRFIGKSITWIRPVTLAELLRFKSEIPGSRLVVGNAEVVFEMRKQHTEPLTLLSARHIPELNKIEITDDVIIFGASVSMTSVQQTLQRRVEDIPKHKARVYASLIETFEDFGDVQIKNVAGIGSHIMTASPLSDVIPLLMAAGVKVTVQSHEGGCRELTLDNTFFTGYRQTCLKGNEILVNVSIPTTKENEYFAGYKIKNQVHRNDKNAATVNAGMRVTFKDSSDSIKDASLAFGGTGPTVVIATDISDKMSGRKWNNELLEDILSLLGKELPLSSDGGMVDYRRSLLQSFFFKFYLKVDNLQCQVEDSSSNASQSPDAYQSAIKPIDAPSKVGTQLYRTVPDDQPSFDSVGRPLMSESGIQCVTGEAVFCDDIPLEPGELHLALVMSTKPHAKIINIDYTEALALKGVHAFVGASDVTGKNDFKIITTAFDEEIFATNEVKHVGQPIGGILAESFALARKAALMVKIDYEDMECIITVEDAIQKDSYLEPTVHIENGNVGVEFEQSDNVIEGEVQIGGQSHFYMETQSCIAKPQERDEMLVIVSSQNLAGLQSQVASALGVSLNKVTCKVRRLGGGFGGKLFSNYGTTAACAVAAKKSGKPVRLILTRQEDMQIIGTRHPAVVRYKVGFSTHGQLRVLQANVFLNGGATANLSPFVHDRLLGQLHNAYNIPTFDITSIACKTNIPPCTAMRGFGRPQGIVIMETIMEHVAQKCGLSPEHVREINLYKEGDVDNFLQDIPDVNNLRRCWTECVNKSDFERRRREVDVFNSENRWKKRGLAVVPQKSQVGLVGTFLNQGAALVHIYTDGSVLLTHGGIEMGQGLHTKTIQIASRVLRIPPERIHINEVSTDKVPNTIVTGASAGTEIYGTAVKIACETLMERLQPLINENPKGSWNDWINAAYFNRVSLSATGFFKHPRNLKFDPNNLQETCTNYHFSYGAACCEVEIDCLTGDHQLIRTDIVMDVGDSLNPALDIGQIEGAFIMGYGLYVHEDIRYSKQGNLLTKGPGMYNLPRVGYIPSQFNVTMLEGAPCKVGLYSSKAMGESPLLLGTAVLMAIKNAIMSARSDAGLSGYFRLDSPATSDRIRLACIDKFTDKVQDETETEDCFFVRP